MRGLVTLAELLLELETLAGRLDNLSAPAGVVL
jgi:hypothetical protein